MPSTSSSTERLRRGRLPKAPPGQEHKELIFAWRKPRSARGNNRHLARAPCLLRSCQWANSYYHELASSHYLGHKSLIPNLDIQSNHDISVGIIRKDYCLSPRLVEKYHPISLHVRFFPARLLFRKTTLSHN